SPVDPAQVAGLEEAVGRERVGRRLGIVVVAREHARAARDDLALDAAARGELSGLALAALHGPDIELDARQRAALGAEPRVRAVVEGEHGRGLGQAVTREHGPAEAFEPPRELGIELRAATADQV